MLDTYYNVYEKDLLSCIAAMPVLREYRVFCKCGNRGENESVCKYSEVSLEKIIVEFFSYPQKMSAGQN